MSEDPSYQYDIFISYSSRDGEWVHGRLVPALRGAGLTVCTDRETFDSSTALQNIENAVAASRHTLLVLSRNWLGSEWTELESLLAQHGDPTGKRSKAVPLLLERQVLRELPLRIAILSHFDFSGRRSEHEELGRLVQTLQGKSQRPREAGYGEAMDERNRRALVQRVEDFWIRGVLRQKLADRPQLTLGVLRHSSAVARPLAEGLGETERPPEILEREEDIFAAFQAADRSLLILGDPGSGKTTALLMMAREAIAALRDDEYALAPVIFTLSSWTKGPIDQWLAEELLSKYQVPLKHGGNWIEHDQLLLLLDGLDEVPESRRADCLGELRVFLTEHGLAQIVLCSRTGDYERLAMPLQLQSAVLLQPLTLEQLRGYLQAGGDRFAALERLLCDDAVLCSLATSPLMLSVMTSVFHQGAENYPQHGSLVERQSFIFDRYIEQALGRRAGELPWGREGFLQRLRWLAWRMRGLGHTLFLPELLQPDWLLRGRIWYQSLVTLASLALIHLPLLALLIWSIWNHAPANASDARSAATASQPTAASAAVYWINLTMIVGLYALTWGRNLGPLAMREIQTVESLGWSWRSAGLVTLLVAGGVFLLGSGIIGYVIASVLLGFFTLPLAQVVLWLCRLDRRNADKFATVAGLAVFASVISYGLWKIGQGYWNAWNSPEPIPDAWNVFYVMFFFSPAVFFISGLKWRGIDVIPERPTGMWPTARNALLVGLLSSAVIVATIYVIGQSQTEFTSAVTFGYWIGLFAAFYFGGFALLKHLSLRGVMACQRTLPWRCRTLMNAAVDRALAQRAGAAYLFMHREMQEHLARQLPPRDEPSGWGKRLHAWLDRQAARLPQSRFRAWLPQEWTGDYRRANIDWLLKPAACVWCALPLLAAYFPAVGSGWLGPTGEVVAGWSLAMLLGAMLGFLGQRWSYFAGGVCAAWGVVTVAQLENSWGIKLIAVLVVMPLFMTIGEKTWGKLLNGFFSER